LDLEKIHRQLERWNDPSQEVKILSFNAVSSHNLAFKRDLDQVFEQVGEDGTFCFEAGSKNDITRFIRMVGDRERKAGRTPSIKVLRVAGHGSPKGVELSADDFWSINDFPRKPTGELDKDTQFMEFDEDLGDDYLFVLAACLTADDVVDGGQNFASDINTWYGKEVSAAKESTINVSLLPEGREERVMHWVTRPDKPGPRKGVSRTYPKRMSQPQAVRV